MKATLIAIAAAMSAWAAVPFPPTASHVPVRWTVETSRVQPAAFEAYQGETLDLEATMQSYGKPFEFAGADVRLFWQTNGMGSAWWSAPAGLMTDSGSGPCGYKATWLPEYDAGATVYNCFIGEPNGVYRAEFRLRLRPSPGATPNTLRLPDVTYDARLNGTPTVNGTNLIDFVKIEAGAETDPTVPDWAKQPNPPRSGTDEAEVLRLISGNAIQTRGGGIISAYTHDGDDGYFEEPAMLTLDGRDHGGGVVSITSGAMGYGAEVSVFNTDGTPAAIRINHKDVATVDQIPSTPDSVGAAPASIVDTVQAWQTYWDGDDVRLTVTNYYGSLDIPALYLEQKMEPDDDHAAAWFKVVWDERTRWNRFLDSYASITNKVENDLADRAWGVYDSSSGAYSPDGLLQLSQEQIMIASGMAWQKTATAGGCAVWVLRATSPTTLSGETENGYFRIEDGDGNALFEIVKGDKRTVGAVATDIQVSGGAMTIRYNSVSDEHPTLEVCTDLKAADWQTEDACTVATVSWGGTSGAWVATVTPIGARSSLFAKATFEAGGNTYVRNHVATSIDKIVVGGHEYEVSVETVNGKKLLVLK